MRQPLCHRRCASIHSKLETMMRAAPPVPPHHRSGYTLIELLVVIAVIAGAAALSCGDSTFGGKSRGMQSAQSALSGLIALARTKAISSGRTSRILVNIQPTSENSPNRFLRYMVVQTQESGHWRTIAENFLPAGVYLVPGDFASLPAGLFSAGVGTWSRSDGTSPLRSTALRSSQVTLESINSDMVERWVSFSFSGVGTTTQTGDLVLALGTVRANTTFASGDSPITLSNPDQVCGITLSSYGLSALIANRAGF